VETQRGVIDHFVGTRLTATKPEELYHQKTVLIIAVITAAIVGILTITTLITLLTILIDKVITQLKHRRDKRKYDLIPTYHNAKDLQKLNTDYTSSHESILPTPPIPTAPNIEDIDIHRQQTIIPFRNE